MKWAEFFQADEGPLSMTRLLCFMAFWPATYVLVTNPTEANLFTFLGVFSGSYVGGKFADASITKHKRKGKRNAHPD